MQSIDRHNVHSSSLAAVAYDPATSTLEIEFKNGAAYRYTNVEAETVRALLSALSIGRYFVHNIKGHYAHAKIEERKK